MNNLSLTILLIVLINTSVFSQVSGIIYRDYNGNGVRDSSLTFVETRVEGVTITAYPASGSIQTKTSNATGTYSFTGLTLPVRLEFSGLSTSDYPSSYGTGNSTSVQFYSTTSITANFGVNYPSDYCQTDPAIVTPVYVNGRQSGTEAFYSFPYSSTGQTSANTLLAQSQQIGSTWGVAYDRTNQIIYTSAFIKRHVSLVDNNGDGKEDIGAIYTMSPTGSPALWLDFQTLADVGMSLMPTIASRALPTNKTLPSHDGAVYDLIGKIGIGDIDISDDFKTLYLVNLFDKKVYSIDIATKTLIGTGIPVPNPCSGGSVRPFGLKYYKGKIYVGSICDAQTSQSVSDLDANLYRLDAGTFNNILNIPLDYVKGIARTGGNINSDNWNPWTSNFTNLTFDGYPQPIFADIEFDINGDAILVFNDRYGHQMSTFNYNTTTGTNLYTGISSGDILRAAYSSSSGIYTLENNGIVGGFTSSGGVGTNQGPGGGEFYYQEHYINYHNETVEGGAAFRPGSGQVAVAAYDPFIVYSAGIYWMNNINGSTTRKYQVNSQQEVTGSFGKTNGIGDIEMLCDPAPIEIGNRIWLDSDNDGIQDPEESTIAGVTVQLVNSAGTVIGTAVTNSTGNYLFSNAPGTSTSSFIYGITGLTENVNYTVRIPNASGAGQQSALSTYSLTTANVGGATGDIRDSDGTLVGTNAEASVLASQIPVSGANNHTFDFGFLLLSTCSLSSTGLANVQCNNNGTVATSTDDYITFSLNPSGSMLGSTYTVSSNNGGVVTPSSGSYGTSTNFRLQNGSANGSTIYTITITDASGAPCQIMVNVGPVSPCSSCPNPNCGTVTVTRN